MRRRAFTITELLVVVSTVSLLAALLFPTLGTARDAGKRAVSVSNVRQITLAQFLYKDDFDDAIAMNRDCHLSAPGGGPADLYPCTPGRGARGWIDLVVPYVKSYAVFKSPMDTLRPVPLPEGTVDPAGNPMTNGYIWGFRSWTRPVLLGGDYRSSYARNNNFANNGVYTARFYEPTSPATTVLIYSFAPNTGSGANGNEGVTGSSFTIVRRSEVQPEVGSCRPYDASSTGNVAANFLDLLPGYAQERERRSPSSERYNGYGIYGFADGHAKALRPGSVRGQCSWGTHRGVEMGNDGRTPDFRF